MDQPTVTWHWICSVLSDIRLSVLLFKNIEVWGLQKALEGHNQQQHLNFDEQIHSLDPIPKIIYL